MQTGSKAAVALSSVIAAVLLTVLKLAVGLGTGSLGLLAEAAHSGLDLVAALTTLWAVRIADREADASHPYGHGRFESVSALFETLLLLVTCVWVIYEAIDRLVTGEVHVESSIWAFAVMAISIAVDWSRSRALKRAAAEHGSAALEADALHFSTDIWSSAVVMVGLGLVWLGERISDDGALARADAVAALVVAGIVIWVSARLGVATIASLVDTAPAGLADQIKAVAETCQGVLSAGRVRLRRAGNKLFVDLAVSVARTTTFAGAHEIADRVEDSVKMVVPEADVVVHVEPVASPAESAVEQVQYLARQRGVDVHDVRIRQVGDALEVDLHVELDPRLKLSDAHAVASRLEDEVLATNERISAVNTHLEAPETSIRRDEEVTERSPALVEQVRAIADRIAGPRSTHGVRIYRSGNAHNLVMHTTFGADQSIERVHELSAQIERALRAELDEVGTVLVHAEPPGSAPHPLASDAAGRPADAESARPRTTSRGDG
jgi:cation diffusion facilitator family transporter